MHHQLAVDSERVAGDLATLTAPPALYLLTLTRMQCHAIVQCREQNAPSNAQALRALDTDVAIAQ